MIKKCLTLTSLAISITDFCLGMGPSKEQPLLETLGKQRGSSFVGMLPRELIGELQKFLGYHITDTINLAKSFEEAIKNLKELALNPAYAHYFKDPKDAEKMIYALDKKFNVRVLLKSTGLDVEIIARRLNTIGAQRWLKELRPLEKELVNAIRSGDLDTVKNLTEKGVNVNATTDLGDPLPDAILHSPLPIPIAQQLLKHGANPNSQDMFGQTALWYAVHKRNPDMVKLLLKYGADVNIKNQMYGNTSFMIAISDLDDPALIKLMLEHGANLTIKNKMGRTAVDIAQEINNPEIIEMLQKAIAEHKK